jgi:hypothetical protein
VFPIRPRAGRDTSFCKRTASDVPRAGCQIALQLNGCRVFTGDTRSGGALPRLKRGDFRVVVRSLSGEWVSKRKSQFGSELILRRLKKVSSVPNSLFFLQRASWWRGSAAPTGWKSPHSTNSPIHKELVCDSTEMHACAPFFLGRGSASARKDVRVGPARPSPARGRVWTSPARLGCKNAPPDVASGASIVTPVTPRTDTSHPDGSGRPGPPSSMPIRSSQPLPIGLWLP